MNYANIDGEPVDLDDPEQAPPWYDPDAVHDRNATAERVPFTWLGLIGKRARIATDLATYEGTVIDYTLPGWVEMEHAGRLPASAPADAVPPVLRVLVNLAHVRTIRPL